MTDYFAMKIFRYEIIFNFLIITLARLLKSIMTFSESKIRLFLLKLLNLTGNEYERIIKVLNFYSLFILLIEIEQETLVTLSFDNKTSTKSQT